MSYHVNNTRRHHEMLLMMFLRRFRLICRCATPLRYAILRRRHDALPPYQYADISYDIADMLLLTLYAAMLLLPDTPSLLRHAAAARCYADFFRAAAS